MPIRRKNKALCQMQTQRLVFHILIIATHNTHFCIVATATNTEKKPSRFATIRLIDYLCGMDYDKKRTVEIREIISTPTFDDFYHSLPQKAQTKFDYVINVIATVYNISTKFIKHLTNTDLYEMRVSIGTNEYRTILFAADNSNFIEATQIILLNGFLKKSTKDYNKHIQKALQILTDLQS